MERKDFEFEDDDIITMVAQDGTEIDFIEIADIYHEGNYYVIAQPVELLEGMEEDSALVFKVEEDKKGETKFTIELDDDIVDAVFKEYDRLYEEAQNED